jgi:hypothetical protein
MRPKKGFSRLKNSLVLPILVIILKFGENASSLKLKGNKNHDFKGTITKLSLKN